MRPNRSQKILSMKTDYSFQNETEINVNQSNKLNIRKKLIEVNLALNIYKIQKKPISWVA